jgi:hypothetical protein
MKIHLLNRKRRDAIRTDGQDTIKVVFTFKSRGLLSRFSHSVGKRKFGQGQTSSMFCALARPYRQLIGEGKPVGRINYVFFHVNEWPSHILGSLCFTPGQRLLFYPGLTERQVRWSYLQGELKDIRSAGSVDHITLEKGYKSWHMTILESDGTKKDHMQSSKVKVIDKNMIFWFGLSLQDASALEITPEELSLTFPSPPRDSDRRIKELLEARENALFHLTTLNAKTQSKNEFIHFDFFVGPPDLIHEILPCFAPIRKPIVFGYSQTLKEGTPFRNHPVSLEGISKKVWIVTSKHIGQLSDRAIFTIVQ